MSCVSSLQVDSQQHLGCLFPIKIDRTCFDLSTACKLKCLVPPRAPVPIVPKLANLFVDIGYTFGLGSLRSCRPVNRFPLSWGVGNGIDTQFLPLDVNSPFAKIFLGFLDEIWPVISGPSNLNLVQSGIKTIR